MERFAIGASAVLVLLWAVAVVGWVLNIVWLVLLVANGALEANATMAALRAVGILFAPLGAVLGYF